MLLKDVIQELKKYNIELETNVVKIRKENGNIIFNIEENNVRIRKAEKFN